MARLNIPRAGTEDSLYRDRTPTASRPGAQGTLSPSPAVSFSSDKENRESVQSGRPSDKGKGKRPMAPPGLPTPNNSGNRNKRRRLGEQSIATESQNGAAEEQDDETLKWYNPEQDPEERRRVRQGMRNNARELHDRYDEFLNNDSSELVDLINRQDGLMEQVRQTSDATLDARFLVTASDLTYKRATRQAFGDSTISIDVDEFVSKCITFMKNGRALRDDEEEAPTSTQARRNRRRNDAGSEDEGDDGDALPWDVLGEKACFPNNKRPAVPSFLLGPLSVQKRIRATQRQGRQRREQVAAVSKPQELQAADLERSETSNLTNQCQRIRERLQDVMNEGVAGVDEEGSDDMDEEEARDIFKRNHLAMNYQVPLFEFAVNPRSFGQTVENLFYISFLVKDGFLAMEKDDDGLPTLRPSQPKAVHEQHERGAARHQAILSLNWGTWQKLIKAYEIEQPLIPHRDDDGAQVGARGWYG